MNTPIGSRVGAILGNSTVDEYLEVLGFGTYDGNFVPHGAGGLGPMCVKLGKPNPRITLDNGKVVWGCECWWGPEEIIKTRIAAHPLVRVVDIDEVRKGV